MLLFYIIFGDRNPPYPALGSNIPSARRCIEESETVVLVGVFAESLLLKQAWRNPKEGRVGNIYFVLHIFLVANLTVNAC